MNDKLFNRLMYNFNISNKKTPIPFNMELSLNMSLPEAIGILSSFNSIMKEDQNKINNSYNLLIGKIGNVKCTPTSTHIYI